MHQAELFVSTRKKNDRNFKFKQSLHLIVPFSFVSLSSPINPQFGLATSSKKWNFHFDQAIAIGRQVLSERYNKYQ